MKWFLLLTKRNFKKPSFIFILLFIPLVTLAMTIVTSRDPSVIKIGYTCEGEMKKSTKELFLALEKDEKTIDFKGFDNEKDGDMALRNGEIESLWVFPSDIAEVSKKRFSGDNVFLARIINREESEMTELAQDSLFCHIFPYVSYSVFENYVTTELPGGDTLTKEDINRYYTSRGIDTDVVEVITLNSSGETEHNNSNYITAPLRGILCVIVLLASLAAAMYTLSDVKRGLFGLFTFKKRFALSFCSVMSSAVPTGIIALISIYMAGLGESLLEELTKMALFVLASVSLALMLMAIFKSPKAFATAVPIITVMAIILSPIFININSFSIIQKIFPSYYYLYSFTDTTYLLSLVAYSLVCTAVGFGFSKKL